MTVKEAIILAGGLGTRLRSVVSDLPKCMAPVAGKPFLHYVIEQLTKQGINKFIFATGYKSEIIEEWLKKELSTLPYQLSIETEPLGTGGAIKQACEKATEKNVLIVNGDTLFNINVEELSAAHTATHADCTLVLKPMKNFDRYGVVELNENNSIGNFKEKQFYESGLINGGVYVLNVESFLNKPLPVKFSFEKDYLETYFSEQKFYGVIQSQYFIDIGIPEDYERAQTELPHIMNFPKPFPPIDQSWTLFLDRDGVINHEKHMDYIRSWDEFKFYDGVPEALKLFNSKFKHIVIVTNQKGVGKGWMTLEALLNINHQMTAAIEAEGGRIDSVYFCTDLEETSADRKPNTGMGLRAQKDFPAINFSKSIMIGNTLSDMEFGRRLGMFTVFLKTTRPDTPIPHPFIDRAYNDLLSVAKAL
ncbi:MAG: HAD-IIIA family hydrolase [Sphingobacteriales bacterium]|nr:MAG: HAD-IIIA family hydrolase [Sphingobacteriales bacterium]